MICCASSAAAAASSAFSPDRSMTSFGRPRRTWRPEARRRGEIRSGGASSQLAAAGTGRASRSSSVAASITRCRAGARPKAARQRRWAEASLSASANQRASVRRSVLRSLRVTRRSWMPATARSRAGIEARARARSTSAWAGASSRPMNQERRPAHRACQLAYAAA
jgi:hypothetical protein